MLVTSREHLSLDKPSMTPLCQLVKRKILQPFRCGIIASNATINAGRGLQRALIEIANTEIRAPFDGIVDDRMTDVGDYVERGDVIARVTTLDPILIVAQVSERDVGRLETIKRRSYIANQSCRQARMKSTISYEA